MSRCAPARTPDYPVLPREELYQLKKVIFQQMPHYWSNKEGFEKIWRTKCWVAIEQACRRIHSKEKKLSQSHP